MSEWISVDPNTGGKLPLPFTPVLVAQDLGAVFMAQMDAPEFWVSGNGLLIETPTHWMPLPEPPK